MITRSVFVDCRKDSEKQDRAAAGIFYGVEAGSKVVVFVGERRIVSPYLIQQIVQFVPVLHIEFQGSDSATEAWVKALMGQGLWEVL